MYTRRSSPSLLTEDWCRQSHFVPSAKDAPEMLRGYLLTAQRYEGAVAQSARIFYDVEVTRVYYSNPDDIL